MDHDQQSLTNVGFELTTAMNPQLGIPRLNE